MSSDIKPSTDAGELLQDIQFVNNIAKEEIVRIRELASQHINDSNNSDLSSSLFAEEISEQLGHLKARIGLCEQTLVSLQAEIGGINLSKINSTRDINKKQQTSMSVSASKLEAKPDLLPLEYASDGTNFRWSSIDPKLNFEFQLDRSVRLELQIRLFALIKSEYAKQLKVLIDGEHIKHRFELDNNIFVVRCVLPVTDNNDHTEITIVLPATHSPKDLGTSRDDRKLGIAINEIRFSRFESRFSHWLKRLKLKS